MPKPNRSSSCLGSPHFTSPFPHPSEAQPDGLLAAGGDLTPEWLLAAYANGIFPWFEDDDGPVLWWSPDPRAVIAPGAMRVTRSLAKRIRQGIYTVSIDRAFPSVIEACAERRADTGTWITERMVQAYTALHRMGYAHSVEVWHQDQLVGGLYGLSLGRMFFGESMFADVVDASKVAFAALHAHTASHHFSLIDCQLPNPHLMSLGVQSCPRDEFLQALEANDGTTLLGPWSLDADWADRALAMRGRS